MSACDETPRPPFRRRLFAAAQRKRQLRRPLRALSWRNVLRRIRRSELRLERLELGYRDLGGEG